MTAFNLLFLNAHNSNLDGPIQVDFLKAQSKPFQMAHAEKSNINFGPKIAMDL